MLPKFELFRQKKKPSVTRKASSVSKNPFRHAGRLLKKFRKPSNSRLSAYRGTVGREMRRKSKSLRSKQNFLQNRSLYVILRNAVTKNPSSTEVRRSFAFAQDDIDRNLDSVSDTLSCHPDFDGYGLFDSLKAFRHTEGFHCFTKSRCVTTISKSLSSSGEKNRSSADSLLGFIFGSLSNFARNKTIIMRQTVPS